MHYWDVYIGIDFIHSVSHNKEDLRQAPSVIFALEDMARQDYGRKSETIRLIIIDHDNVIA